MLKKLPRTDLIVFGIVLVITVYEDLMVAMAIGVIFAFFRFIQEVSSTYQHKTIPLSKTDCALKGKDRIELDKLPVSVLQPQGPLFFGSVEPLIEAYSSAPPHEKLVVDLSKVTMVDLSGVYALEDLIMDAKSKNIEVFVANADPQIKETLEKVEFIQHIGEDHYMNSMRSVIPVLLQTYNGAGQQEKVEDLKTLQVPMLEKFQNAINENNIEAVMNLYDDDAILVPAFSSNMKKGKDEIRAFYEKFFEKDEVKISISEATSQRLNGTKVDNGIYIMKWNVGGDFEEEQLRFSLVMKSGKIITDHSSIEPDFVALNGHLPKAYESEFEMSN